MNGHLFSNSDQPQLQQHHPIGLSIATQQTQDVPRLFHDNTEPLLNGFGPTPRATPVPPVTPVSVSAPTAVTATAAVSAPITEPRLPFSAAASSYGLNPNNVQILNVPQEPLSDIGGLISLMQAEYEKAIYELDPTLPQPVRSVVQRSVSAMDRRVPAAATVSAKCPEVLQYSYAADFGVWYPSPRHLRACQWCLRWHPMNLPQLRAFKKHMDGLSRSYYRAYSLKVLNRAIASVPLSSRERNNRNGQSSYKVSFQPPSAARKPRVLLPNRIANRQTVDSANVTSIVASESQRRTRSKRKSYVETSDHDSVDDAP